MAESHALYKWMTVRENGRYQASFHPRWNQRIFDAVVGHFRLLPKAKASTLSRGQRAGLSLAITLAPQPELLILDDPALGLDPVARRLLLEAMIYVTRGADRTIFFSSHLIEDVERVADHLAILDRSVLRASCPMETFRSHVRQFVLRYPPGSPLPATVPDIPGLLHMRKSIGELRVTLANASDATLASLRTLGASVEEVAVGFEDALIGYLGDRGEQKFFLEDTLALESASGTQERGAA
jgi:ABC-2 type transport system ATP-binding protein